jgi:hypothetical protein
VTVEICVVSVGADTVNIEPVGIDVGGIGIDVFVVDANAVGFDVVGVGIDVDVVRVDAFCKGVVGDDVDAVGGDADGVDDVVIAVDVPGFTVVFVAAVLINGSVDVDRVLTTVGTSVGVGVRIVGVGSVAVRIFGVGSAAVFVNFDLGIGVDAVNVASDVVGVNAVVGANWVGVVFGINLV